MKSVIYKITNNHNGKFYIGSAINVKRRFIQHKFDLKNNKHHNKHLQDAWNKYGEDKFTFEIVETCDKESLIETEQKWIDQTKCYDRNIGYNICAIAGSSFGLKRSEDMKALLSKINKGKKLSEETRAKMKASFTKERRNAIAARRRESKINEETRQKISEALKNKGKTKEQREKISKAKIGDRNPMSTLKESDVLEIRRLAETGIALKNIAEEYKVRPNTISRIVNRKRWNHI